MSIEITDRLYYHDSYLTEFQARVIDSSADRETVYLDRTAFYPTSGGQPFDLGVLGGIAVETVVDEDQRIAHVLRAPLTGSDTATPVKCEIDWPRRFDHMQQHSGQHLLSAVFAEEVNASTVSFHLGTEFATIDLSIPALDPQQIQRVERRANEIVFANRPVHISFEEQTEELGLRKHSERQGILRLVSIDGLDRSACGGTHVRSTGEIGPILIRKLDRVRNNLRVEFLCGMRALRRARADYDALSQVARIFSAPLDETPGLVTAQAEKLQDAEKARRRLSGQLASSRGRDLYAQTAADQAGLRKTLRRIRAISEEVRMEAQSFCSGGRAVMLLLAEEPPSVLLVASQDSGWNAGAWLKQALAKISGRGGGTAITAQGSVPGQEALDFLAQQFDAEPKALTIAESTGAEPVKSAPTRPRTGSA
ncbi:MAG: alanyl-tRNA editing protein [Acidobacteriota bacterium]|nr:alanyl-tRNA editing protein [Acidobacteriota bacterium]